MLQVQESRALRLLDRVGGRDPICTLQQDAVNSEGVLRGCAPLPPQAGEMMDTVVSEVGSERLSVAATLMEFVSRPLADWWATYTVEHEKISRQGRAQRTMKPGGQQLHSMVDRTPVSTPIYATEQGFEFHERFLRVAAGSGISIEADSLRNAFLNINETVEDASIFGTGVNFANLPSFGLETAPNANTVTLSGGNPAWDDPLKTGEEILNDYLAMRTAAFADKHFGPFFLWHEINYQSPLDKLYTDGTTTQSLTVREMLLKNQELIGIAVADQLADDKVFLAEMQTSTCGIYVGQDPTWLPMQAVNFDLSFLALASLVPYFRDDFDGGSGIVEATV